MRRGVLRRQLNREIGQALVLVAIAMPLFFALLALVTDGSNLMVHKRSFQNAADAAALASSAELPADDAVTCTGSELDPTTCLGQVHAAVNYYTLKNGISTTLNMCTHPDPQDKGTSCYLTPYKTHNSQIEIWISEPVAAFFAKTVGLGDKFFASARAVGGAHGDTGIHITPGSVSIRTDTNPLGRPTAIFSGRVTSCGSNSFFIPGSGNVISGVWANGAGTYGSNNTINGIRINQAVKGTNCDPIKSDVSQGGSNDINDINYQAPVNPVGWPVPFPSLSSLFTSPDSHCLLYSGTITQASRTSGVSTATTSAPHCLEVGDPVTVNLTDNRFDCTACPVTAVTSSTFKYVNGVVLTINRKALTAGKATLTSTAAHGLSVGASITVNIGDARFDGTFLVTDVPTSTTFSYTAPNPVTYPVTNKALASTGVETLTSAGHHITVGSSVTVSIGDPRFNGTYNVTAVGADTCLYNHTAPVAT
jgi:hypothetical protein